MSQKTFSSGDRLFLIDGSAFIFRAFHALPPLSRSDGLPIGAVSGFCNMLFKLREELSISEQPTHIAVIFDAGSKTFRNDIYSEYKAHRPPPPEDLIPQFSLCRDAARAFGFIAIEQQGYEADDIMATYADQASKAGAACHLYSSDKDLMQLVDSHICMVDPMKNKMIYADQVIEKFGVPPEKVPYVQALAGDSSDNIPGVPGIGVKTAAQLIDEFGDLEYLLQNAHSIKQKKRRENLIEYADLARISYELVCLKKDVQLSKSAEDLVLQPIDSDKVMAFLGEMELKKLAQRVAARLGTEYTPQEKEIKQDDLFSSLSSETKLAHYHTINTIDALEAYLNEITEKHIVAIDTETTGLHIINSTLVGISLSHTPYSGVYIPLGHHQGEQLSFEDVIERLKPICRNPAILKIGHNIKYDMSILAQHDIVISPYDDTMLLSAALYAGQHKHNMDALCQRYLNHTPTSFEDVCGKGKKQITFDQVPLDKATYYAAEDSDMTLRLWHLFKKEIILEKRYRFYQDIERPMPSIVAQMERHGIQPDLSELQELSNRFALEMATLEQEIYAIAGQEFNIASPKQLGEILFTVMALEYKGKKKKTAGGQISTSVDVLEDLASQGHNIAELILRWRTIQKLKSTYADALADHICNKTQRIHTSFHLTGAVTGRFSSSDPNMQNIPIKSEEGRLIRKAFIAPQEHLLVSADYSQVELRLLAHIANVTLLKQAFETGEDIHKRTASEVFNIPLDHVDSESRRRAKAVNFGIIYGISPFGLARQLNIPQSEAKQYIDIYFERFPQIQDYMEHMKEMAKEKGYVETLFGRKIHIKDINTRNFSQRSFAERMAINAPIQGSAADMIKCSMIKADQLIQKEFKHCKQLLQIHDELVFEVPKDDLELFSKSIKNVMEKAPFDIFPEKEKIPLIVEVGQGKNWDEAH